MRFFKLTSAIFLLMAACVFMGFAGGKKEKPSTPVADTQVYEEPKAEVLPPGEPLENAPAYKALIKAFEESIPGNIPDGVLSAQEIAQLEQLVLAEQEESGQEEFAQADADADYDGPVYANSQKPVTARKAAASAKEIPLASNDADGYYKRASEYYDRGDYDNAIKNVTQVIKLDPDYTEAYILSGLSHYANEDYQSAIEDFETAISISPRDADAYNGLGVVYAATGKYDSAIDNLTKAIRYDPTVADNYKERGFAYLAKNEYTHAIQDFERLINSSSDDPNVYSGRGFAYIARGNYAKAIPDLTEAIRRLPSKAAVNAYIGRGLTFYNTGDYDAAIKDFTQAIKVAPVNSYSYYGRGLSYTKRGASGDDKKAIADYMKAIELNPTDINAYNALAKVYSATGDYDGETRIRAERNQKLGITAQSSVTVTPPSQPTFASGTAQQLAEDGILRNSFPSVSQ